MGTFIVNICVQGQLMMRNGGLMRGIFVDGELHGEDEEWELNGMRWTSLAILLINQICVPHISHL